VLAGPEAPAGTRVDYEAAIREAAGAIAADGARVGVVVSPRATSETMFAWRRLAEGLGGARVGVHRLERGEDDHLLIRRDRGANSTGARWIFGEGAGDAGAVVEAARRGEVDVLLVVGDVLDPDDVPPVPADVAARLRALVYVGPFLDAAAQLASVRIPAGAWTEEDGSVVNFEGRIQLVRRARPPRSEIRPGWRVAADLAEAVHVAMPGWASAADVLRDLAAAVPAFDGATPETIGLLGRPTRSAAPAGR